MTVLKKTWAVLLAAVIMISFAFSTVNAYVTEGRETLNVEIEEPVVGRRVNYEMNYDKEHYAPGMTGILEIEKLWFPYTSVSVEDYSKEFLRMAEAEPDSAAKECAISFAKVGFPSLFKNGIAWKEYDFDAMEKFKKEHANLGEITNADFGHSTSAEIPCRFIEAGEEFKEGKGYTAIVLIQEETASVYKEIKEAAKPLKSYYEDTEKLKEKRMAAAMSDDRDGIAAADNEYEGLKKKYEKEIAEFENAAAEAMKTIPYYYKGYAYQFPILTVNGEKTVENLKGMMYSAYDFGQAKQPESVFDSIKIYFENILDAILDFFRTIFTIPDLKVNLFQ